MYGSNERKPEVQKGLNPYSNGTMYLIDKPQMSNSKNERVLILILMEQCI